MQEWQDIKAQDFEGHLAPFVEKVFAKNDPEWIKIVSNAAKEQRKARLKRQLLGWLNRYRRTQKGVEGGYTQYWGSTEIRDQLGDRNHPIPCEWGDRGFIAHPQGPKRIQQSLLIQAIQQVNPKNVLEVGFGNGLNLLLLSARFPQVDFSGIELTAGGLAMAKKMQSLDSVPQYIADFSSEPLRDLTAHKKVKFQQGNAVHLPFADNSFDMIFTSLALEQMEEVRDAALKEIARVTRDYAVFVEPFRDFNSSGLRRDYIVSKDYFAAKISDLRAYGLEPVYTYTNIPCKLTLGVGLVVAKKIKR